jgi:4-hydroxybenzoate polyprenyltransferase
MVDDPEIKDEIADAKEDLRDALHEINHRVEKGVARIRPDRGIRKHPVASACIAGALGFALGSDSGEGAIIALLLFGTALIAARAEASQSGEIERV